MTALDLSLPPETGGPTRACLRRISQALRCLGWILASRPEQKGLLGPCGWLGGSSGAMAMNLRRDEWPHLSRSWKIKEAPPCFPLPWGCLSVWMDFLNMDLLLLIYWLCQVFIAACRILVPQPRIEPWPPALRAHRLNHWITREIPTVDTFKSSYLWASQVALVVKNLPANAGDTRVTSTAGYCFCFGSLPSFFLKLFLH